MSRRTIKIEELVGLRVFDLSIDVSDFEYEGSIPLQESKSKIMLDTKEVFDVPYSGERNVELLRDENLTGIFEEQRNKKKSALGKILSGLLGTGDPLPNEENIVGKEITAVYQSNKDSSESDTSWEKCLIELESGVLISEKEMAPNGTGHAGIWIFESLDDFKNKIGNGLEKVV